MKLCMRNLPSIWEISTEKYSRNRTKITIYFLQYLRATAGSHTFGAEGSVEHFHEFFTQIFFDNFSREIKVVNS